MNICFLASNIEYKAPHAGFSHTYNVCKNLKLLGNEVLIVFKGPRKEMFIDEIGIRIITIPDWAHEGGFSLQSFFLTFKAVLGFMKICRQYKIELIHERSGLPRGIGIIAARLLGLRCFVELNDPYVEEIATRSRFFFQTWRKAMISLSNQVLTQTPTLKQLFLKDARPEKITVVSNGVDLSDFNLEIEGNHIREKYRIPKDSVVILFVGAFRPWHGVNRIPTIARDIKKHEKNVVFLLVGKGELFPSVKNVIESQGLQDTIILTGPVPHEVIPEYYAAADIGVAPFDLAHYPKLFEHGFWWCPVKLFEYMAMEKPIVTVNAGMNHIIVPDGKAGFLSDPNDFNAMTENLLKLISDPVLREEMGRHGRRHVEKNFQWSHLVKKIYAMYLKHV